jgi:hypothetical protein
MLLSLALAAIWGPQSAAHCQDNGSRPHVCTICAVAASPGAVPAESAPPRIVATEQRFIPLPSPDMPAAAVCRVPALRSPPPAILS